MNILFLMGGENTDYNDDNYPIYMAEMNEGIVLEKQIDQFKGTGTDNMIFCVRSDHIKDYSTDSVIQQAAENSTCVEIVSDTSGSVCTALLAAEYIDNNEELILVAIDELIDTDISEIIQYFRFKECAAGVVTFRSVHPRYSFARVDESDFVSEVAEKKPISKNALASFYYFESGHDFVECAMSVIRKDNKHQGAFYLSQTINEMILRQKRVGHYHIENSDFHPLKTEMQLAQYMLAIQEQRESR